MIYPVKKYRVTCEFGKRGSRWKCGYHSGVDFVNIDGRDDNIYCAVEGNIFKNEYSASYGNFVVVRHKHDSFYSLYAHLVTKSNWQIGELIREGDIIGKMGSTGNVTGKHLHFEVRNNRYEYPSTTDPILYIGKGGDEVKKDITIKLNGVKKTVSAVWQNGNYFVKLRDLADDHITVDYKDNMPVLQVK